MIRSKLGVAVLWGASAAVCAQSLYNSQDPKRSAYEWQMADVQSNGGFVCPQHFTYLVLEQLSMNDQGAVHYRVRGEGGERQGVLSPTQPQPHEQRIAAALRSAASQPLQQPVAIMCVRAAAEDPWFTFGTSEPYRWKKASGGPQPCGNGRDGLRYPLVIAQLSAEGDGRLRYTVRGAAQSTSGVLDPEQPTHSQVRLVQLLSAHAGQSVPPQGIALCTNAHEDDPLVLPLPPVPDKAPTAPKK